LWIFSLDFGVRFRPSWHVGFVSVLLSNRRSPSRSRGVEFRLLTGAPIDAYGTARAFE
jgi:hypothetical protein